MNAADSSAPTALRCPQCGAGVPPSPTGYAVCRYCGSNLIWNRPGAGEALPEGTAVRGIRLKVYACTDTQGTGLDVFRMLVPVGWQIQGGCNWLLDNPAMPATVAVSVSNPQGAEAFEILPNMNFTWNPTALGSLFSTGSRQFGAEVRAPMGVRDALRSLVLPRFRSRVQNLQILNEAPVPDLPRLARSEALTSGGSAEGAKIRVRYTSQGVQIEEEIYGVVEVFTYPVQSLFGTAQASYWLVDFLFSFRAAAGRLDSTADLFGAMITSVRPNPHWYAAFKGIAQRLSQMQIQRIRHIGQIGQIYAQTGQEIREQNLNDWYARQSTYDRIATDRSRQIRDVDAYYDPHKEETVELPAGYGHAWANNLGEYILTESPSFNPNEGSNLHWEPMTPQ